MVFQYAVQKNLNSLSGVLNMANNYVVFCKNSNKHGERLRQLIAHMPDCNLTLNPVKCPFGMSLIKFIEPILSKEVVSPDSAKVKSWC